MNGIQIMILVASIAGVLLWSRSESREDNRKVEVRVEALIQAIHAEMKDFHGRLCALEEKNRGK